MRRFSFVTISALVLFFALRIGFALSLPIFNDESIYLHWGKIFQFHPNEMFFATELDGKPPGTTIFFGILTLLPFDPLYTVRFTNILFSFTTLLLLASILKRYFSKKYATLFIFLYAVNPFLVLFDTLALQEPSLTLLSTLLLSLTLSMMRAPTLLTGIMIGLTAGIGSWIKPNIMIFLPGLLTGLFLAWRTLSTQRKNIIPALFGAIVSFLVIFLPLRCHPLFTMIERKTAERAFSFFEILTLPFGTWISHTVSTFAWFIGYGTIPVILLSLFGIVTSFQMKKYRFFILWFILPILATLLTAKMLTARYIVYGVPILILFSTLGIMKLTRFRSCITICSVGISLVASILLALFPLSYSRFLSFLPRTQSDFAQYVSGWTSGYGIKEALLFLEKKAAASPIVITVRLDSGNPEDAMYLYGERIKNAIVGPENEIPSVLQQMNLKKTFFPIYFVSRGDQHGLFSSCLTKQATFEKPLDPEYIGVYEIDRACAKNLIEGAIKN